MSGPSAEAPVFISYSRKDYYFAESLALHLLKEGVPAWMDVKDLNPGAFWQRDLFAALDQACCVVIVASADSMKSPNVRQEIDRAISQHKRIIIARFRGSKLADELCNCEVVDFRGAFRPALQKLIQRLKSEPPKEVPPVSARLFPKVPVWVAATVGFLLVPTLAYFALADVISGSNSNVFVNSLFVLVALILGWLVSLSFLQRRMGMTRLAVTLAVFAAIFAAPVIKFLRFGESAMKEDSSRFAQATIHHWPLIASLAAIPLLGLAMIALLRPYDLLRWAPTGKAWRWYRRGCAARVFAGHDTIPAPKPKPFFLLHDTEDFPAAEHIRQNLAKVGWTASTPAAGAATVLLLTNRTETDWLLQQQQQLTPDILTVVATTICLPAQMEWLWKHEWIDLRNWKIDRLHSSEALPQVPEAVTMPRFPLAVKFANHLLCCLGALGFVLLAVADPVLLQSDSNPPLQQELIVIVAAAVIVLCLELARRLLRRSITAQKFYLWSWISYGCALVMAGFACWRGVPEPVWLRSIPAILFLLVFPMAFMRTRKPLEFWFPSANPSAPKYRRLEGSKKYWRTFWCFCAYLGLWGWISGMMSR
jgi:hypothetical protein